MADALTYNDPVRADRCLESVCLSIGHPNYRMFFKLRVTPYAGDGGIDVTGIYRAAGLTEVNAAVQVKHWKGNVRAPTVTQLRGSLQVHQQGITITTSDYSKGARKEASASNKTRIGLINGEELIELLIKHKVGVQEKTLRVVGLDDDWWGELLADEDDTTIDEAPTVIAKETDNQPDAEPAGQLTLPVTAPDHATLNPTGRKPTAVTVFGQSFPVNSWKAVLVVVCKALAALHGDAFRDPALALKGRKRRYIVATSEGMISPYAIEGTDLWVETNLSAQNIMTLTTRLLETFDHDPDAMQIETK